MTYLIKGLDPTPYLPLFGLPDAQLAEQGAVRIPVTSAPGFPCRVSLEDAPVGSSVLLINHVSHDVPNPYRASHAIFIGEGAEEAAEFRNKVPPALDRRVLSLRGFDDDGMMADARLASPGKADAAIRDLFAQDGIAYIHAHNAVRGCFAARIERA